MPQKNVKKLIKKEVKRVERKVHPGKGRKFAKSAARKRVNKITKGAGKGVIAKINALATGASIERRAAAMLARKMCCPNMFDSFAVQDGFNAKAVGAANPYMVSAMPFSAIDGQVTDAMGIKSSESWLFAFRDPHRCLMYYDPTVTGNAYEYNGVQDSGSTTVTLVAQADLDMFDVWNFSSGVLFHGTKLFTGVVAAGRGAGRRFTICNKNNYIKVTGLPASTLTTLAFWALVNDEMYLYNVTATSTAGGVGTFALSGATPANNSPALPNFFHIGLSALDKTVTAGTFSIGAVAGSAAGFRQFSLAQFDQLNQVVEKLRFSALNLMFSNTAQELYKGGIGFARQVPSNLDPFNIATQGYDYWASKPEAERLGLKNGIMTFYKPTDIKDLEFRDIGDPADGGSGGGNYEIDSDQDYLMIAMSQPVIGERGGYVSVFTNVEYKHNNVWFPLIHPDHTRRVFEDALEIIASVPQTHENPFHIKDIFKWIGQHKGQIQQTISQGASAFGGARAEGYANRANQFLDIWFK